MLGGNAAQESIFSLSLPPLKAAAMIVLEETFHLGESGNCPLPVRGFPLKMGTPLKKGQVLRGLGWLYAKPPRALSHPPAFTSSSTSSSSSFSFSMRRRPLRNGGAHISEATRAPTVAHAGQGEGEALAESVHVKEEEEGGGKKDASVAALPLSGKWCISSRPSRSRSGDLNARALARSLDHSLMM